MIPIPRKILFFLLLPITFFLALLLARPAFPDDPYPVPQGLINDFAHVIPPAYEERMDSLAREVLEKADAAVAVVTLEDIGGADIDEYTNKLYERWGIGKKGEDRGAMILVALQERKIRIEIGYGLEGIIPDGLAGQIRDQAIVPYLKNGEFGPGLFNGLAALSGIIAEDRGIELAGKSDIPDARPAAASKRSRSIYGILPFLFLLFVFLFLFRSGRGGMGTFLLLMLLGGGRGGFGGRGSMGGHGSGFGGFGGGFGGFGGGMSGGGGASGSF
ncbi:MAG: TPM domain-containing protein [Thermodesulfobacteriota bacterium]